MRWRGDGVDGDRTITLTGGVAPGHAYFEELLPDIPPPPRFPIDEDLNIQCPPV